MAAIPCGGLALRISPGLLTIEYRFLHNTEALESRTCGSLLNEKSVVPVNVFDHGHFGTITLSEVCF
jgi:hypothetical protein